MVRPSKRSHTVDNHVNQDLTALFEFIKNSPYVYKDTSTPTDPHTFDLWEDGNTGKIYIAGTWYNLVNSGDGTTGYVPYTGATANLALGNYTVTASQLASTIAIGTAPMTVTSTTLVTNLNADMIDGYHSSDIVGTGDLKADGSVPLTANWDVGAFKITASQFASGVAVGTTPFVVTSTTVVDNLNVDQVDGYDYGDFALIAHDHDFDELGNGDVDDEQISFLANTPIADTRTPTKSISIKLGTLGTKYYRIPVLDTTTSTSSSSSTSTSSSTSSSTTTTSTSSSTSTVADSLQESYSGGYDNYVTIYTATYRCQTFTAASSYNIGSVQILCKKLGTPAAGNITVSIHATTAGKPSGDALCSGALSAGSLPTSATWVSFDFGAGANLTASTVYAIVAKSPDSANESNCPVWYRKYEDVFAGGQYGISTNSGVTWTMLAYDMNFKNWGA